MKMIKIEFKQIKGTQSFVGLTDKGNSVTYNFVYEDRLGYYVKSDNELANMPVEDQKQCAKVKQPTKLRLECNFRVTTEMLDIMQESKIMEVLGRITHEDSGIYEVTYLPRPHFSYEKLQDIIVDICDKYNL